MIASRLLAFVKTKAFHILLLLVGLAFLLTGAFHGNVWFDESYSVAIANHSFADIWDIGSGDVHPVLFYWALHVLNLVFGQNVLVYRLFTVAGTFSLALLGLVMVRHDFGWKTGLLFSLFALFTPYLTYMAVEIRMYSWASFTVMLCALYAWRVACTLARNAAEGAREKGTKSPDGSAQAWWASAAYQDDADKRCWANVPCAWWLALFCSSLASAYLHYYGVLAAFLINAFLLAFILVRARKALPVLASGAAVQVLLYVPWLAVLASQVGVVSGSYWADVVFPRTLVEWAFYPIATSYVIFADTYGQGYVVALGVCADIAIASAVYGAFCFFRRGKNVPFEAKSSKAKAHSFLVKTVLSPAALPALWGVALYLGVFLVALAASVAMDSLIVYYRYLSVTIGPLLLAASIVVAHLRSRVCVGGLLTAFLGASLVNQLLFIHDAYSEKNQEPLTCFEESVAENGEPLVLSSDIGIEGVTAVSCTAISQTFLAWQPGDWAHAYQSYAPTLSTVQSWDAALDSHQGSFIVLGQASREALPKDVTDLASRSDVQLESAQTFYRPYERTWFTIAVMEKE